MDEKTFFDNGTVKVTNARFMVGAQTFAMSNVTSVSAAVDKPSRVGGVFLFLIGLGLFGVKWWAGLGVCAFAMYYLYQLKTSYHLMLRASGGETKALTTQDQAYMDQVVGALNEAIVHRG